MSRPIVARILAIALTAVGAEAVHALASTRSATGFAENARDQPFVWTLGEP
jgi:hypothetical protein